MRLHRAMKFMQRVIRVFFGMLYLSNSTTYMLSRFQIWNSGWLQRGNFQLTVLRVLLCIADAIEICPYMQYASWLLMHCITGNQRVRCDKRLSSFSNSCFLQYSHRTKNCDWAKPEICTLINGKAEVDVWMIVPQLFGSIIEVLWKNRAARGIQR